METSSFRRISEVILDEVLSWEPSYATQLGWHKYDDVLPDWSAHSHQHQLERMNAIVRDLSKMDRTSLSDDEQIDADLGIHFLKLRIFELDELRLKEKASMAAKEIGDALFFLFARDRPALEQRLLSITARLERVPAFIEMVQKEIKTPYGLWNEIQCETGDRLPSLLKEIEGLCDAECNDMKTMIRLKAAAKDATNAVEQHNNWLRKEVIPISSEEYSIGADLYRRYLLMKGFGVSAEETLHIAELHLEDVNRRKAEISKEIVGSGRPQDAIRKMRGDHPATSRDVLDGYRSSVQRARRFVEMNKLVTLPKGEQLSIIETPYFMRHLLAYAAQFEPGRFDDDMKGLFLVTPEDGTPALLEEHSYTSIENTSVHEGYPGHHLHGVCMNLHPSLIRPLCQSPDFAEGWALYCEEMMLSQGYNDNPMGRLMILNDIAFRIARQICDVKLSTGSMTVGKAAEFIAAQTETNMKAAESEAKSIMLSPTYFMSYFVGKLGVLQIRDDVERAMGAKFDLGFFHDSLIYSGCMPMSFMRRAVALRLKEKHGIRLDEPGETLYDYALRILKEKAA